MEKTSAVTHYFRFHKKPVFKYIISVMIVFLAAGLQYILWDYISPSPYLLFFPAIILAALYGDGTSAIILSCLITQYVFVGNFEWTMSWPQDYVRMFVFIASSGLIRKLVRELTDAKLRSDEVVELLKLRETELSREKYTRERYVASLTHDLRNPLSSIQLQVQLLKRKSKEGGQLPILENIQKSTARINGMIQDMLDADQIATGKGLRLKISRFDIKDLVDETVNNLTVLYGDRFILKTTSVEGNWSFDGLRRVVENLCSNAVKYGDAEEKITIITQKSGDSLLLHVNNKGQVIPDEDKVKMFTLYERLSDSSDQRGWGLGLPLVKALVEAQSGSIELVSTPKEGTTFTVYLPVNDEALVNISETSSSPQP